MSMSVDGLVSGMDTTALITQLLQAEAGPQLALKKRLSASQTSASAYRTVNTSLAAVRAAAEGIMKSDSWTPTKASSSASSVSVTGSTGATPGSLTFTVLSTATAHSVLNKSTAGTWTSASSAYGASSITVLDKNNVAKIPAITITDTNSDGTLSLTEAATAINASTHGLTAAVVQISSTEFALQVTSRTTGVDSKFSLSGSGSVTNPTLGTDARIKIGSTTQAFEVASSTNTFSSVLPGATFTVSKEETSPVTVSIAADPETVAAKVQALVDAVNAAVKTVRDYTNNSKGSTAALKGDFSVSQLAGQLLDAVSSAIGSVGSDGKSRSPATVGFELSKDGRTLNFSKDKFLTALKDDPALAQTMIAGRAAGTTSNGTSVVAVTGLAERLLKVARTASDSTTGSLVKLAEGQDTLGKDIQDKIEAWDLRLAKRKEMLTRQFSAMETALSSLKNQSTWLAGQINSLPKYS
jgi:flagellar hook-associated protein 2